MESFDLQFLNAHWGHEPMQSNDQLSMHMHQKLANAEEPILARFMGSFHGIAVAHWNYEPAAKNDWRVVQLRNLARTRFVESLYGLTVPH